MRSIQLLAPARNADIGREAILHGADAVYIGAPRFGARAAAGNTIDDIASLVRFAHPYGVAIYVTFNTILYDDELDDALHLVHQLYDIGVDALIIQDTALLEMDLPPIPLHASTQMDNRTPDKVQWLRNQGFRQVVLARELTLDEITAIHHSVPDVALEVFVHGATCVCYNGRCQASQYCYRRSANRGECAQFCRLPFDVVDHEGNILSHPRTGQPLRQCHPLSLHDMNRSDDLETLLQAGASSLKIEGRLKDAAYVKNVVAHYRQRLDDIIRRHPDSYCRSSHGRTQTTFTPDPSRSFNRGFTPYFLHGRTPDLVQMATPKSMGQYVGTVKEVRRDHFTVRGTAAFANGDGLCFIDSHGRLQGFRINRAEGNHLYPKDMPRGIAPRTPLYRNLDQAFEQQLAKPTATRRIAVSWTVEGPIDSQLRLTLTTEDGRSHTQLFPIDIQQARTPQHDNIRRQLARLGDTPYEATQFQLLIPDDIFLPSSLLATWRRDMVQGLTASQGQDAPTQNLGQMEGTQGQEGSQGQVALTPDLGQRTPSLQPAEYTNHLARQFYTRQGITNAVESLELRMKATQQPRVDSPLMVTRYCLRYELGICPKHHGCPPQPLSIVSADHRTFPLHFDCRQCQMHVLPPTTATTHNGLHTT